MTSSYGTQEFEGATFVGTSFRGATLRSCDVSGVMAIEGPFHEIGLIFTGAAGDGLRHVDPG